jgi:hypothetical protein
MIPQARPLREVFTKRPDCRRHRGTRHPLGASLLLRARLAALAHRVGVLLAPLALGPGGAL